MGIYDGEAVLVTGATGMIGSQLTQDLCNLGARVRVTRFNREPAQILGAKMLGRIEAVDADLRRHEDCLAATRGIGIVFNLAAILTNVTGNIEMPTKMFTQNALIQTQMLEAARQNDVDRYLFQSSACVYPSSVSVPFEEADGLKGSPDSANEAYGWAKRMGEIQAKLYYKEVGMKIAVARPFNTYGPRDNFSPRTSHVIPALITKAQARKKSLRIWGDGRAVRDFVYVTDVTRALTTMLEKYPNADPVNVATGKGTSISELASMILQLTGNARTKILYEPKRPAGQLERIGSTSKGEAVLGFKTRITLRDGLKRVINWVRHDRRRVHVSS